MNIKAMQFIINSEFSDEQIFSKLEEQGQGKQHNGKNIYIITKERIDKHFFWLYFQYDNVNLYGDKVFDNDKEETIENKRNKSLVELREQLFVMLDINNKLLYISDFNKKKVVKDYIENTLQREVTIKNIYSSIEDFRNSVKEIKKLSFTQLYNVQNCTDEDSIFMAQANELGFDLPKKITMKIEYSTPVEKAKQGIENLKKKREKGFFEDIVLIGEDDNGIEQNFDFASVLKNIVIDLPKNDNDRYDAEDVKNLLLGRIRDMDV